MPELFELSQDGEVRFTGPENSCYYRLQSLQPQSADWAMKYGGWKVDPKEVSQEEYDKVIENDPYERRMRHEREKRIKQS